MIKVITVLCLLIFNTTSSFAQEESVWGNIKDSCLVIIPLDTTKSWSWKLKECLPLKENTFSKLKMDSLLKVVDVAILNHNGSKESDMLGGDIDLNKYLLQVVGGVNIRGEEVFWINCLCKDYLLRYDLNWKNNIVQVYDGGKCFFNLKVNLALKSSSDFYVNGY